MGVISHYGVKGMHWGQHKSESSKAPTAVETRRGFGGKVKGKGGKNHSPHPDALEAAVSKQKARHNTTDSLSTRELQLLVNRLNLEQQYSRLITGPDGRDAGNDVNRILKKVLGAGKTINDLQTFANSAAGKVIKAKLGK